MVFEPKTLDYNISPYTGLTRSFFIAAPMIYNIPELELCGYKLREYYKNQILSACVKGNPFYVGSYEEMQELTGHSDPFRCFQQTVETCALVIGLWVSKAQNWRLFNMLDMAFLHMEGYDIDREIMLDHAQAILNYSVGDGFTNMWGAEQYLSKRFHQRL